MHSDLIVVRLAYSSCCSAVHVVRVMNCTELCHRYLLLNGTSLYVLRPREVTTYCTLFYFAHLSAISLPELFVGHVRNNNFYS